MHRAIRRTQRRDGGRSSDRICAGPAGEHRLARQLHPSSAERALSDCWFYSESVVIRVGIEHVGASPKGEAHLPDDHPAKSPRALREEMTRIFTSFNQLTSWLRQVERLRHAASFGSRPATSSQVRIPGRHPSQHLDLQAIRRGEHAFAGDKAFLPTSIADLDASHRKSC